MEEISANPVPISSHARPESRKTITGHFAEASISLSSARATVSVGVAGLSEVARLGALAMSDLGKRLKTWIPAKRGGTACPQAVQTR